MKVEDVDARLATLRRLLNEARVARRSTRGYQNTIDTLLDLRLKLTEERNG